LLSALTRRYIFFLQWKAHNICTWLIIYQFIIIVTKKFSKFLWKKCRISKLFWIILQRFFKHMAEKIQHSNVNKSKNSIFEQLGILYESRINLFFRIKCCHSLLIHVKLKKSNRLNSALSSLHYFLLLLLLLLLVFGLQILFVINNHFFKNSFKLWLNCDWKGNFAKLINKIVIDCIRFRKFYINCPFF